MDWTLWQGLARPGITSLVGAGGKSTILRRLAESAHAAGKPSFVTTTTKMYHAQVVPFFPYIGYAYPHAEVVCTEQVRRGRYGGWFSAIVGDKVHGVPATALDRMSEAHPSWHMFVEADGAKCKWLKVPKLSEPVIPERTVQTIGVLNLRAMGRLFHDDWVHNLHLLLPMLGVAEGTVCTPEMLATVVRHEHGLFQYAKGRRVLCCTGADQVDTGKVEAFLAAIADVELQTVVLCDGYEETLRPRMFLPW